MCSTPGASKRRRYHRPLAGETLSVVEGPRELLIPPGSVLGSSSTLSLPRLRCLLLRLSGREILGLRRARRRKAERRAFPDSQKRDGGSPGFHLDDVNPYEGIIDAASVRAPIFRKTRFRCCEDERPLTRTARATCESCRCTNLVKTLFAARVRQRSESSVDRSSSTLMCSGRSKRWATMVYHTHRPVSMLRLGHDAGRKSSPESSLTSEPL